MGSDVVRRKLRERTERFRYRDFLLSGFVATGFVLLTRSLGMLQLAEFFAFDRFIQARPAEITDDRIVIVGFNEADFRSLGSAQITDEAMAKLLLRIREQQPRVIGLDLYRNLKNPPGHQQLLNVFETTPNLIGIEKVINSGEGESVLGNPVLAGADRVAASDVIVDADGRVRRGFLFPNPDHPRPLESLSLRLALEYLAAQGMMPEGDETMLRLGRTTFPRFEANDGGYRNADAGGYQVLLNLRGRRGTFKLIPARKVLSGEIPSDVFRDRIVMIGDLSVGASDIFFTSYNSASGERVEAMSGVELHANLTSQIISAVLDGRPFIRTLSDWAEWLAIAGFAYLSAWINGRRWTYLQKSLMNFALISAIVGISYGGLIVGWWLPTVPVVMTVAIAALMRTMLEMKQLSALSNQDGLTRIANRRAFDEMFHREWSRAVRSQTPLGLIICDVDFFKSYNDTYGHLKGDDCLRKVAIALQQSVKRSGDMVARYGGEEFVILLPNTDAYGTIKVAKLIQTRIEALQIAHRGSQVSPYVTISLGASNVLPSLTSVPQSLIDVADAGLYEAKQQGRNQVVLKLP